MDRVLRAIETQGRVLDARHIETDADLPVGRQVRLVEHPSESEWLAAARQRRRRRACQRTPRRPQGRESPAPQFVT